MYSQQAARRMHDALIFLKRQADEFGSADRVDMRAAERALAIAEFDLALDKEPRVVVADPAPQAAE